MEIKKKCQTYHLKRVACLAFPVYYISSYSAISTASFSAKAAMIDEES